jgi:hypothetical protein
MEDESALGIVQQTESITALVKFNDVHEAGGIVKVSTDLAIHLDTSFHAYLLTFLPGKCILETFAQDDTHGETFTRLVWSGRGLGGPHTSHLTEVPMTGRIETLEVLTGSASHVVEVC